MYDNYDCYSTIQIYLILLKNIYISLAKWTFWINSNQSQIKFKQLESNWLNVYVFNFLNVLNSTFSITLICLDEECT